MTLAVLSTHPIQYHAPVYRYLQTQLGIPVTAIYGSDFSVAGYHDREFGVTFAWDSDLLSGYSSIFLSRVAEGGAASYSTVAAQGAYAALTKLNPQTILLTGYQSRFHRQALWAARRTGRPLLLRAETTDHAQNRSALKQLVRDGTLRAIYTQFDRFLYIGQRSREHYLRLGCAEERLVFSPYCVDTTPFSTSNADREALRSATREQFGIPPDCSVLLFSGKLVHRKGPDLLLRAYQALPDHVRDHAALVFLGDGEMKDALQQEVGSSAGIYFAGFQNQSRLSAFYHMADLLVMPSRFYETWGLVVNEALYHGLPCVVSDSVGCAPDLVQPGITGEVFAADSIASLCAAMVRGIGLSKCHETADKCKTAVSRFTVAAAAGGIAAGYALTLQGHP